MKKSYCPQILSTTKRDQKVKAGAPPGKVKKEKVLGGDPGKFLERVTFSGP